MTTLKQTLENNIVYVLLAAMAAGAVGGWSTCEVIRVTNKTEKIADYEKRFGEQSQQLKESAISIEQYKQQISELLSNKARLETESTPHENPNCSVVGLVRAVEKKKGIFINSTVKISSMRQNLVF